MKKILKFSDFVKKGEAYNEEKPTKPAKKKINNLSWDSSFGEQDNRPKTKKKEKSILSWDSSFGEQGNRNRSKLKEETNRHHQIIRGDHEKYDDDSYHGNDSYTDNVQPYMGKFHDDVDVRPLDLSYEHKDAIRHYTSTGSLNDLNGHSSSSNINGYLRNRLGDKKSGILIHTEGGVRQAVRRLSSAFTEDNTNRKPIKTWGAVPSHIGHALMNSKPGTQHHFAGFTSTSSNQNVAGGFAIGYKIKERKAKGEDDKSPDEKHIIRYHLQPHTGLSAVHHSDFGENEVILHHGAKVTYHGSQVTETEEPGERKQILHIHHVTVHPQHLKLEEYGDYDHPKNLDKDTHPNI